MRNVNHPSRVAALVAASGLVLAIGFGGSVAAAADNGDAAIDWAQYIDGGRGAGEGPGAEAKGLQATAAADGVTRLQGANRYATAVEISRDNFAPGVEIVFIASGASFPDALSGAPIAGMTGSPVLLVPGTSIPAVVRDELTRLQPQYIVVLGGEGVVSAAVADELESFALTGVVDRLAGQNRFATSAFISSVVFSEVLPDVVFVANGMTFPDALAAGPAAGLSNAPMLLVQGSAIPSVIAQELDRLDPEYIVIMGGDGAVSVEVEQQLGAYAPNVGRIAGTNRFSTAANLSSWFWDEVQTPTVYIANGMMFPDALAVAPVGTVVDAPILLVSATSIPAVVKEELVARQPQQIVIVGGSGAISDAVAAELGEYVVP